MKKMLSLAAILLAAILLTAGLVSCGTAEKATGETAEVARTAETEAKTGEPAMLGAQEGVSNHTGTLKFKLAEVYLRYEDHDDPSQDRQDTDQIDDHPWKDYILELTDGWTGGVFYMPEDKSEQGSVTFSGKDHFTMHDPDGTVTEGSYLFSNDYLLMFISEDSTSPEGHRITQTRVARLNLQR